MPRFILTVLLMIAFQVSAQEIFKHELPAGKKPWTHEKFLEGGGRFSFVIIPDRTGSERPGVFQEAVRKANMLQPEFIITVGDLIQGPTELDAQSPAHLREMWRELETITKKSEAPFFYLVGNHDISRTRPGFPRANEDSTMVWKEFAGANTYYSFIYKNVLFLCLNTMEGRDSRVPQIGITDEQADWAVKVLKANPQVRWTFVFLHQPDQWRSAGYQKIEKELVKRKYTSFAGDWHHYIKFQRHGRSHYVLATAGGVSSLRGKEHGEFDHITYVTMTPAGPVVANILLDGIMPDDVVTPATAARTYRSMLDTAPFKPAPGYPWKALIDDHILEKYVSKANLAGNTITFSGKNAREIIPLSPPELRGKRFRLTAAVRAQGKGSFSVKIREFDASGKLIKADGITASADFGRKSAVISPAAQAVKVDLCIESENFDSRSVGTARYIFVEELK